MDTKKLHTVLGSLSGHIITDSPQREKDFERLHNLLSRSSREEDLGRLKESNFSFEAADLFSPENIAPERFDVLEETVNNQRLRLKDPEFKVFLREVPLRSTQFHASMPLWSGGSRVSHTVGPFTHVDGRKYWYDFYRIEKLIALYILGNPEPALLFKIKTGGRRRVPSFESATSSRSVPVSASRPVRPHMATSGLTSSSTTVAHEVGGRKIPENIELNPLPVYNLPAGSIWINSQLLCPSAPPGYYTGLTIKGGTISLSAPSQLQNDKLTIGASTKVTVNLQLQQQSAEDEDPSSPYGRDAREAQVNLPRQLMFRFSGQTGTLQKISGAKWNVYGHEASFSWLKQKQPVYDNLLHRILIPFSCSETEFSIKNCQSPFHTMQGTVLIRGSAWALPAAPIDVSQPTTAAGTGALAVLCKPGLTSQWTGQRDGSINLNKPYVMAEPGRIAISDAGAGNVFCRQKFKLWRDELNPFGASIDLQYKETAVFFYNTFANGNEALMTLGNADVRIDRPVSVAGEAFPIQSKNSMLVLAVHKDLRLVYLFDDNILLDNIDFNEKPPEFPSPVSLALTNALFKVSPVNGCLLFGELADDFVKVHKAGMFLTLGVYAYIPSLPDPYAARLGILRSQFRNQDGIAASGTSLVGRNIWLWLVCHVTWQADATYPENDQVDVAFHFAPLQNQFQLMQAASWVEEEGSFSICDRILTPRPEHDPQDLHERMDSIADSDQPGLETVTFTAMMAAHDLPDYQKEWDNLTQCLQADAFALLDVSTNADLLGVSFDIAGSQRLAKVTTHTASPAGASTANTFPLQVQGLDVVSHGANVRAFTVPQISWEPVLNTAPQVNPGDPPGYPEDQPPEIHPNYYPDDGGPTRISNNSVDMVPLSPNPVSEFIVDQYKSQQLNITSSLFTLPFGLRALAVLNKFTYPQQPPKIQFNRPQFEQEMTGGLQMRFIAGKLPTDDYPMFNGGTLQMNNVLDWAGNVTGASTLGSSVSYIFNEEFKPKPSPDILISRGVPLTRIDFCGYGASMFSNWFNPMAQMDQTSQSKFDVWVGRTAHEVIQVRSEIEPYGAKVVRTIILYRALTGYVYRVDTGWQPESDGRFDFSYYIKTSQGEILGQHPDYEIHPGIIKGLFNIENIVEEDNQFETTSYIHPGEYYLDDNNFVLQNNTTSAIETEAKLQMVFFDADVEVEGVVQGHTNGRVPSKKIMGFVQLAPRGIPLSKEAMRALLNYQPDPIGGPLDCVVDIGESGQQMRLDRFDVSNSFAGNGVNPVFVAAGRGNVILPKEGSWSMVRHQRGTGEVTPLPEQLSVPLVRIGPLVYNVVDSGKTTKDGKKIEIVEFKLGADPKNELLRLANPADLLRSPGTETINYGFLHSTDTQKALLLTPSFKHGLEKVLSKTPPLFADAFRIVNSKAVFPNIGDADAGFGDAISLFQNKNEFVQNALKDGGKNVLELMDINKVVNNVKEEGYKLLRPLTNFDLPATEWELIEIGGSFRIYIEYKADDIQKAESQGGGTKNEKGALDFDIDSFTGNLADKWKSRMANVALVVDLGPIDRLMTIKGNWDAKMGAEAAYKGSSTDPDFPSPQIEFAPELKPVIEILQILQEIQTENYAGALEKGLKLAMSNKAGSWEYKLEASKEIPVLRFPPGPLYNDPNQPLKLEAGLKLGAYFNAALKVTSDPNQLLPTAGGYLGFYGKLSVMCVSLSAATIYAVGQVNLDIAADTKVGPSLKMKFGFGAQIVVGLPVVGSVSVLYMVGVEIYADSVQLNISAFMLFQGHAELLGGIVSVTITIEARGTISRAGDRTDLAAQVTFGLDISIFLIIDISFETSWEEQRQIA